MGMGRGAGSTALGLFQILPVFLCIFPSGKEQPLYFEDLSPPSPSPPCISRSPWIAASIPPVSGPLFSLPLFAAVGHMFKRSKWGSVLVWVPLIPPRSLSPPSSCGGCFSLTSSSLSPRCLIPPGRRWWKSKRILAEAAGGGWGVVSDSVGQVTLFSPSPVCSEP